MCAFHSNTHIATQTHGARKHTHKTLHSCLSLLLSFTYSSPFIHSRNFSSSRSRSFLSGGHVFTTAYSSMREFIFQRRRRWWRRKNTSVVWNSHDYEFYFFFYKNVCGCECLSVLSIYIFVIRYKQWIQYICAIFIHITHTHLKYITYVYT